jgi:actin-like ATPase involved in cell morphogenesis
VLAHPAGYGPYKLGFLEEAARLAGVGTVRFVAEPVAAAIYYARTERVAQGEMIGVYDFGGGTLDLAIVRKSGDTFEVVGAPEGMERFGGIDMDEAVFGYVDDVLGGIVGSSDYDDDATVAAMAALRNACREAKEALSADTDIAIPVMIPNLHTEVRLTRGEFEDMIRPRLRETLTALERAVGSAGVTYGDLSRILLVGGASRIPLVAEMVREATGRPVAVDAHPKHAVALGAALVPDAADASPRPFTASELPVRLDESSTVEFGAAAPGLAAAVSVPRESIPEVDPEADESVSSPEENEPEDAVTPVAFEEDDEDRPSGVPPDPSAGDGGGGTRPRWLYPSLGVLAIFIVAIVGLLFLRGRSEQPGDTASASAGESGMVADAASTGVGGRVAAVYHVGYRTVDHDGEWGAWSMDGHEGPGDIASDYLPTLGLYSSADQGVRNEHFQMFNRASIGIVSIVWGGRETPGGPLIPDVLDDVEGHGLSAVFVLRLPSGGGPEVLRSEIEYLYAAFGDQPALFKPSEPGLWMENAGMLVVVAGMEELEQGTGVDIDAWRDAVDAIHQIGDGVVVLSVSSDAMWIEGAHFDGLVGGPIDGVEPPSYAWAEELPAGAWFVPVVSPGRSAAWSAEDEPTIPRDDGSWYEKQWDAVVASRRPANLVIVLSFNEWDSGTQIEPAVSGSTRGDGTPYLDYEPVSPEGYLELTRSAVERWAAS